MIDKIKEDFLKGLEEVDTGKAQPLFHPFPVINIFREDAPLEEQRKKEKTEEDQLLTGLRGIICDASENVKSQIAANVESEGGNIVLPEEETEDADFVFAMDKGGEFIKFAAANGCVALKATYGLISRHGMDIDAPSLTQAAVGAKNVTVCAKALESAAGVDNKDPMSRDAYIYDFTEALKVDMSGMKIAVLEDLHGMEIDVNQLDYFNQMLDVMGERGAEIETVELEWMEYAVPVHEMIQACEKVMTADENSMADFCNDEEIVLGQYILDEENYENCYLKLLKLRSLIKDSLDMLFRDYSLFLVPYTQMRDSYSVAANLAGLPAMTVPYVPFGTETADGTKLVAGVHMIAGANYENNLLRAAYTLEQEVQ